MTGLTALAPGKVNLCLHLGGQRDDGLHELVSLVQAIELDDTVGLEPAEAGARMDEVVCPGVDGPNLAAAALAAFREATGWDAPPQWVTIAKRVPIAAGMGGGSSDAAATLRLAARAAGRDDDPALGRIAPQLGADVPALLSPGLRLVGGAGERVQALEDLAPFWVLVLPLRERLATADVFAQADRLGLSRSAEALAARRSEIEDALAPGVELPLERLHNDLEPAARSLCPAIDDALAAAREAGAEHALVSGSGPTVVGLARDHAGSRLSEGLKLLRARYPGACVVRPVAPGHGSPIAHDDGAMRQNGAGR